MRHLAFFAVAALGFVGTLSAHHSPAADYDLNQTKVFSGTVAKVEWLNPHVRFDIKDGTSQTWSFELGSPNGLFREGWTKTTLEAGATVTVEGYPAKDGSHQAHTLKIIWSDGRSKEYHDRRIMQPVRLEQPRFVQRTTGGTVTAQ